MLFHLNDFSALVPSQDCDITSLGVETMEEKKNNNFVRILIIGLVGFIIWIVAYSFLYIEPKGSISTGMITLIMHIE